MNDSSKFRVWDSLEKKYLDASAVWLSSDGYAHEADCELSTIDYITERCTGLKDKNGKLIYAGDVVCYDDTPYNGYATKKTGVVVYENGKMSYYKHNRIAKGCHGTGDVYASAFVGSLMRGKSIFDAAKVAADYTVKCIENTQGDASHWYGVKFETALGDLMSMLK